MVSVKLNGMDLGQKTKQVQVRAVNDVPFAAMDAQGHMKDLSPLFAAFVNENSPVIQQILQEALHWKAVQSFDGYQEHSPTSVRMRVSSIWNVLQRHHVKYSNITTASGFSEKIQSQSVRFVDDSLRTNQANCVDGSVLFASVLYKIGIYPVLVKLPGHMFMGYYLDEKSYGTGQNLEFLETTMVGIAAFSSTIGVQHCIPSPRRSGPRKRIIQSVRASGEPWESGIPEGCGAGIEPPCSGLHGH